MGFAIVAGGNPNMAAPVTGIAASTLAVGSTVKLMESEAAVEYLVVNQGIPSSSNLYDSSCDGTWLLRKALHSSRQWHSSNVNKYESSAINTWLNGTFLTSLGTSAQNAILQAKIPYRKNGGSSGSNQSGANGLSCKVFLLGAYEVGWTTSNSSYFPVDGAKLSYFEAGTETSAKSKRIAYLNGSASKWWLRSPLTNSATNAWNVYHDGDYTGDYATVSCGIRPALILSKTALFDENTMILKGVA